MQNRVKLNKEKCKDLTISFVKNEPQFAPIVVDGKELERVTSAKLLGLTISSNLIWNEHISDVIKKASKCLYFLIQFSGPSRYALRCNRCFIVPKCKTDHFRNSFIVRSCIDNIYTQIFSPFIMFFILLYLRFLVLYTHFIGSIICKYAIQPSGCIVLVIKVSIYLQGSSYFAKKKSKFSRDFQGQIRGKNGQFRGKTVKICGKSADFAGF